MKNKENKTHLRLVRTDEVAACEETKTSQETANTQSSFVKQMNSFADELDRMIESILRS